MPVVVGYLPSYRIQQEGFDAQILGPVTDLLYFSVELTELGTISEDAVDATHAKRFAELKEATGCRLLLCVGGWGKSKHFPAVTADRTSRRRLVHSLLAICKRYGFGGVDYDWEHSKGQDELDNYAALIEETSQAFRPLGLLVTVAQAGWQDLGKRAYKAVDRIHLMCYDQQFPQATMKHAEHEVARLIEWGCPPEKIALGLPFYGRNKDREARSYASLIKNARAGDPSGDLIDGYALNGPDTVQAKTEFALAEGLAGVMIWELGHDVPGPRSLLLAVERGINAASEQAE